MAKFKNIVIGILASFLIISVGAGLIYKSKYHKEKIEKERVTRNYDVLQGSFEIIKGRDSINSARIEAQDLTIAELKSYYVNIVKDVEDMKISLRKVAGITVFSTETTHNIHTSFRDSTVNDTIPIQYIKENTKWFDLEIIKQDKDALVKLTSRDSLIQVVHWDYIGKFWPTKFLTKKEFHQDIKSANPNSRITYAEWIKIYRKRGIRKESNQ
jgi:aspartyl/asparaginyl-tRNA synthetase